MKKVVFIVICGTVMLGLSSCRSSKLYSKPCGLASKTKQTKQINNQQNLLVADTTVIN